MNAEVSHPMQISQPTREYLEGLKAVDFELAYLALLTREGLKPMSRWEKPLGDYELLLLGRTGLVIRQVPRTVKTGKQVIETVFGISSPWIQVYEQRFAGQPIDKSPETVRLEGFLFGYPPCCVERYAHHPYAPNDLPDEDRKIIFHWPCKDCRITPLLMPAYGQVCGAVESC